MMFTRYIKQQRFKPSATSYIFLVIIVLFWFSVGELYQTTKEQTFYVLHLYCFYSSIFVFWWTSYIKQQRNKPSTFYIFIVFIVLFLFSEDELYQTTKEQTFYVLHLYCFYSSIFVFCGRAISNNEGTNLLQRFYIFIDFIVLFLFSVGRAISNNKGTNLLRFTSLLFLQFYFCFLWTSYIKQRRKQTFYNVLHLY